MGLKILQLFANKEEISNLIKRTYHFLTCFPPSNSPSRLHFCQRIETETKLSRYLLATQGDRVAMANGVEQRFPFLDEDLVSFIKRLPEFCFLSQQTGKFILREAMKEKLPRIITNRPKQGYLAPDKYILNYYRTKKSYLYGLLSDEMIKNGGYFELKEVKKFLSLCDSPTLTFDQDITCAFTFLLTTQVLHKLFVEKDISLLSA